MKKKNCIVLIPARMGSSRFPGKPLAKIGKETMITRIARICSMNIFTKDVYVATCDKKIKDEVEKNDFKAVITSKKHTRASDRCNEALKKLEKKLNKKFDYVTMVQGDEPMIKPSMINKSLSDLIFSKKKYLVSNLASYISKKNDYEDENIIKIIFNKLNEVISFSRKPIPFMKKFTKKIAVRQVCIISFSREGLLKFSNLKESRNELLESVDMFRFIDNSLKIKLTFINDITYPVDTKSDLKKVNDLLF